MKSSLNWQSPFVDVFKHFKVLDPKSTCEKKGSVSITQDQELGRKVLKCEGQVSSSNYLMIPGDGSSLGLVGNYLYLQMQVPAGSIFAIYVIFGTAGQRYKLSFSNFYKSLKKQGEKELQVSVREVPSKWGILSIDLGSYLNELKVEKASRVIKTIQLCSNAKYKNIFTSEKMYNFETLPREMLLPLPSTATYFDRYHWLFLSHTTQEAENIPSRANVSQKQTQEIEKGRDFLKSILKKRVQIVEPETNDIEHEEIKEVDEEDEQKQSEKRRPHSKSRDDKDAHEKPHKSTLSDKHKKQSVDETEEPRSVAPQAANTTPVVYENHFSIQPTPIMRLSHVHGYSGNKGNLCGFGKGTIVYSSGNVLVMQDVKSREQKYLFGQERKIELVATLPPNVTAKERVIVTSDGTHLSYWDGSSLKRKSFYYTGYSKIISIDLAYHANSLIVAVAGLDATSRPGIMIIKGDQVIVKHLSSFDIVKIGFIDKRDITKGLVSVGKENIRFWWIKGKRDDTVLASHSVYLGEHARENVFCDFVVAQTEAKLFKILIVGNSGNLYIVDSAEKEMIGVFMIHEEGIRCIGLQSEGESQYVITCGNNGKVKIWKPDFSELILEVKLDSQVCSLSVNDFIVCGCLNGTIGALSVDKKKFTVMIRSHTEPIIDVKYHKPTRKVITISKDGSIRIWDLMKLKGEDSTNIFFAQVYEFRCLDEQVTSLQSFSTRDKFLCGFQSGSVRVFDIKQFTVACELEFHKQPVIRVDMSYGDRYGLSCDSEKIVIFNDKFECVKEIKVRGIISAGFDVSGEYFYSISEQDSTCLRLFSLSSLSQILLYDAAESIASVRFSSRNNQVLILSATAKLRKYFLEQGQLKLFREYAHLHAAQPNDFIVSANAQYLFSAGRDSLFKIWDYDMRGGMSPAFQAYNCGEAISSIVASNDDLNLVIAYGKDSNSLYCWKFQASLAKITKEQQALIDEDDRARRTSADPSKRIDSVNDDVGEKVIFSNLSVRRDGNNYIEEYASLEDSKIVEQPIKGLYDDIQQQFNISDAYDLKIIDKTPMFKDAPLATFTPVDYGAAQRQGEAKQRVLEDRAPGEYLDINCVLGMSTKGGFPQEKFIWNTRNRFLVTFVNSFLVVSHLISPQRRQKVIQLDNAITKVEISPNCRYYVAATADKVFDCNSHLQIKELRHPSECELRSIEISPCSNYLLTAVTLKNANKQQQQQQTVLNIWEIASGRLVSSSQTDEQSVFVSVRWNNVTLGALEFAVLYKSSLQFWRLNSRMSLEFQQAELNPKHSSGNLVSLNFIAISNDQKHLALVGTSTGAIIIFDVRSGSMSCICQGVIQQGISEIIVFKNHVILLSNTVNVYRFELGAHSSLDLQRLANCLSSSSSIYTLDSYPISYSSMGDEDAHTGVDSAIPAQTAMMVMSKCGLLWLIDFEESATLRISSTHQTDKLIKACRYIPLADENGFIISSASDSTIKIWELDSIEEKTEFYAPKKECLSFDVMTDLNLIVCGYSDGFIRFYNFKTYENVGHIFLHDGQIPPNGTSSPRVAAVRALPQTQNVIACNSAGDIYILYIEKFHPFSVQMNKICDNLGGLADSIDLSPFDPLSTFVVSTKATSDAKVQVWNRKCLKRKQVPAEELMRIYELEYYLIDSYNIPNNKQKLSVSTEIGSQALFSKQVQDEILIICPTEQQLQIRNFREHINFRQIALVGLPKRFGLSEKGDLIIVGHADGFISIYDEHNGIELDRRKLGEGQEITDVQVFDKQGELTRKNKNIIAEDQIYAAPFVLVSSTNQIVVFNLLTAPTNQK